jgi:hypothetical protein
MEMPFAATERCHISAGAAMVARAGLCRPPRGWWRDVSSTEQSWAWTEVGEGARSVPAQLPACRVLNRVDTARSHRANWLSVPRYTHFLDNQYYTCYTSIFFYYSVHAREIWAVSNDYKIVEPKK